MSSKIEARALVYLVGNYYGGIHVTMHDRRYYWLVENYDTDFNNLEEWQEIPENFFKNLLALNEYQKQIITNKKQEHGNDN